MRRYSCGGRVDAPDATACEQRRRSGLTRVRVAHQHPAAAGRVDEGGAVNVIPAEPTEHKEQRNKQESAFCHLELRQCRRSEAQLHRRRLRVDQGFRGKVGPADPDRLFGRPRLNVDSRFVNDRSLVIGLIERRDEARVDTKVTRPL